MRKAFKMPLTKNATKRNSQTTRRAGPDDYRAMVKNFKAMLRTMDAVDPSDFESPEFQELQRSGIVTKKEMEQLREGYARNGHALWTYVRAIIKELPEAEGQSEMAEVQKMLERAGFPEPTSSQPTAV